MNSAGGTGDDQEPDPPASTPADPWAHSADQTPPGSGNAAPAPSGSPSAYPPPDYPPPPAFGTPPSFGTPPGYAPPPAYGPPPGYGQPPGYGPPITFGPPPGYGPPPLSAPPPGYGQPGLDFPAYPMAATPPGFYAGPDDPLVSATFGDWWTRSFRLLATTWRPILLVQLWWVIPLLALGIASGLLVRPETATVDSTADVRRAFTILAAAVPGALLSVLLISIAQLASLQVVVQRATGQQVSVRAAWGTAFRRTHAMLGWGLLAVLLIGGGFLLCFLPGIYVACTFLTLPAIVLLERNRGIGRAFELFHHKFGDSIGRVATIIGISLIPSVIENIFSGALSHGYDPQAGPSVAVAVLSAIISTVFSVAVSIVTAPLLLTAYADMRARREPFSTAYLMPEQPAYAQPTHPPTA